MKAWGMGLVAKEPSSTYIDKNEVERDKKKRRILNNIKHFKDPP